MRRTPRTDRTGRPHRTGRTTRTPRLGRRHRTRRWRRAAAVADSGQTLPLVAVVLLVAAGAALLVASVGGLVVDRRRARTAADAAALAGALDGHDAAEQVAEANGGDLRHYVHDGDEVEVTVRVGRAEATARAAKGAPRAPTTTSVTGGSS